MALTANVTPVTAADATFSATGSAAWAAGMGGPVTVDSNTIVAAKLSASATDVVFGRSTAGAGAGEEIVCGAAGRAILDDASADAQKTTLGVGTGDSPQFAAVNIGHASDTTLTRVSAGDIAIEGNGVYRAGGTDVAVADGGTGASTASGAATNLGLGTGDSPQFTAVNIGHASDTTVTRASAGDIAVEGNTVYRAGGTDVAVADGGTGASTKSGARTNLESGFVLCLTSALGSSNWPDATTLYTGVFGFSSTQNINKMRVARDCTIKRADFIWLVTGTLSSSETSSVSIRVNGTTDTLVSSSVVCSALSNEITNSALSIALTAGDYIEVKWVTPTWATNPTTAYFGGQIYCE